MRKSDVTRNLRKPENVILLHGFYVSFPTFWATSWLQLCTWRSPVVVYRRSREPNYREISRDFTHIVAMEFCNNNVKMYALMLNGFDFSQNITSLLSRVKCTSFLITKNTKYRWLWDSIYYEKRSATSSIIFEFCYVIKIRRYSFLVIIYKRKNKRFHAFI